MIGVSFFNRRLAIHLNAPIYMKRVNEDKKDR